MENHRIIRMEHINKAGGGFNCIYQYNDAGFLQKIEKIFKGFKNGDLFEFFYEGNVIIKEERTQMDGMYSCLS
jgi:hypothetical protein